MTPHTLIEIISAAHLTAFVNGPFPERGGLILVAPPGSLKTAFVACIETYPDALNMSDLNSQQLMVLRDDIAAHRYHTIAFPELEKLYQRHPHVADNIEGHLKAMVDEGFQRAAYEDHRMSGLKARCLVIGAMTPSLYRKRFTRWSETGFARRFLWCLFSIENPDILLEAIHKWHRMQLTGDPISGSPAGGYIPYTVSESESRELLKMLKYQPGQATPLILMKKILSVLRWRWSKEPDRAMKLLRDFAPSLGQHGAKMRLEETIEGAKKHAKRT